MAPYALRPTIQYMPTKVIMRAGLTMCATKRARFSFFWLIDFAFLKEFQQSLIDISNYYKPIIHPLQSILLNLFMNRANLNIPKEAFFKPEILLDIESYSTGIILAAVLTTKAFPCWFISLVSSIFPLKYSM